MRQHRALGQRFGAARVDDLREPVARHRRCPAVRASALSRSSNCDTRSASDTRRVERGGLPPVSRNSSLTASALAPELRRMYAISCAFSMKLIGTSTPPDPRQREPQRRKRV